MITKVPGFGGEQAPPVPSASEVQQVLNPIDTLNRDGSPQLYELSKGGGVEAEAKFSLNDLKPLRSAEEGFEVAGVPGDLLAVVEVGDNKIGIIDTKVKEGYRTGFYEDENRFMTVGVETNESGALVAVAGVKREDAFDREPDTSMHIGRSPNLPSQRYANKGLTIDSDPLVSRGKGKLDSDGEGHGSIRITENGELEVIDSCSTNGTNVILAPKLKDSTETEEQKFELRKELTRGMTTQLGGIGLSREVEVEVEELLPPESLRTSKYDTWRPESKNESLPKNLLESNKDQASLVSSDEVVRVSGNNGKEVDAEYLETQANARKMLVDSITNGDLYKDKESFKDALKVAHVIATDNNIYNKVGGAKNGLKESERGVFLGEGIAVNKRIRQALSVSETARIYNDKYEDRFNRSTPDSTSVHEVILDGISPEFRAKDTLSYDDNGVAENESYRFYYPDGKGNDEYFNAMQQKGDEIVKSLNQEIPDIDKIVGLVAEQYQYGAIVRPFAQVNNSLFMNLANAQLKLAGLPGITHGEMDLAAQRMQPATFKSYFKDRVDGRMA